MTNFLELLAEPWALAPLAAVALGCLLTAVARRVATSVGLVDSPDAVRKLHRHPTPVMGGVAFFTTMLVVLTGSFFAGHQWIREPATARLVLSVFSSATLFCVLGVIDDRFSLRPRTKLIGQIVASLPYAVFGMHFNSVCFLGWAIDLGPLAVPFAIFWLVACSNVINLIDGLDGLAGTVGVVAMLTVATIFADNGAIGPATVTLVAAGSVMGFLIHNWPPARIFMGDGGSMTIGCLVGALSIEASSKTAAGLTLGVPLIIISIPVFDTFVAIVRRKLNGLTIGEGDREHIHHRLQDRGLSRRQVLLAITGLSMVMAAAAITATRLHNDLTGLTVCGVVLATLVAGRIFGHHETLLFARHVHAIGTLLRDTSGVLRTRFLLARMDSIDPSERLAIWQHVSQRVAGMGGTQLEFCGSSADGRNLGVDLTWTADVDDQIAARITPSGAAGDWRFEYRVSRSNGLEARMAATGITQSGSPAARADDLLRLFDRVCREMPLTGQVDQSELEPTTLPMSVDFHPNRLRRAA